MATTMDAKDVDARGKALIKASSEGVPPTTLVEQLKQLEKAGDATEEILRSTRIGQTVNKFRSNKNPQVARIATELVSRWKRDIQKAGAAKGSPGAASKPSNGAASPTPAAAPAAKATKAKHDVPPEKRNAQADGVKTEQTGNKTRDSCLKLMYDGLAHLSDEDPDDILVKAIEVERAAYDRYQPETSEGYRSKMRMLFQNLKNKSNPQLRIRVLGGQISAEHFVVMSHDELKSAERRAEEAQLQKENMNKAMVAQEEKSISASLSCSKCGQRKVSYTQAQTRSADEPMTTFCECMVCGKRWKFS